MKKIFTAAIAAVLMLAGTNAFAQISVGAGWINSTMTRTVAGTKLDGEPSNGFYVGANYNINLIGGFGVAPGLYYSLLVGKGSSTIGTYNLTTSTFTEHALNVPIYFNYGYDLNGVKFLAFVGPTLQYALSSKYKGTILGADATIDSFKDLDQGPFNVYIGGGLGAEIASKLQITVGFDYGLLNLYKGTLDNTSYKRYNIKIGVGYLF